LYFDRVSNRSGLQLEQFRLLILFFICERQNESAYLQLLAKEFASHSIDLQEDLDEFTHRLNYNDVI